LLALLHVPNIFLNKIIVQHVAKYLEWFLDKTHPGGHMVGEGGGGGAGGGVPVKEKSLCKVHEKKF
jgi:hypothetical protein